MKDADYIDEDPDDIDEETYQDEAAVDADEMIDYDAVEDEMLADMCEEIGAEEDDTPETIEDPTNLTSTVVESAAPTTTTPEVAPDSIVPNSTSGRTECGHKTSCIGGFIDSLLFNNASITNKQIADSWNGDGKRFLTKGMINGHIQHLIKDHSVNVVIEKLGKGIKKFSVVAQ